MKISRDWSCSTLWYLSSNGDTPRPTPTSSRPGCMIEDADLLDQAQRRVERQQIDQRAESHAFGRARNRAQIDTGTGTMLSGVA